MKGLTKTNGINAEEIKEVLDKKGLKYVQWRPELRPHTIKSSSDIEYIARSALDDVFVTEDRAMKLITKALGPPNVTAVSGDNIIHHMFSASYQINSLDFIKSIPYFQEGYQGYIRFRKTGEIEQLTKVIYNDVFVNSYKEPIIIKPEPIVKT